MCLYVCGMSIAEARPQTSHVAREIVERVANGGVAYSVPDTSAHVTVFKSDRCPVCGHNLMGLDENDTLSYSYRVYRQNTAAMCDNTWVEIFMATTSAFGFRSVARVCQLHNMRNFDVSGCVRVFMCA